ncbi:MAG: Uma2 family endonuclease [Sandaracinaceae bacterium]|nr:Uma2 family endonuclease [Sandaracinaceae bacterium]
MEARDLRRVSLEEYVALDRTSEARWEYVDGEAFAMAGASPEHNLVVGNVAAALRLALRDTGCLALSEGQKVATPRTRAYHHPDALVICGEPRYDPHDDYAVLNPSLIVEVLSPSTADYDRGGKLVHYRTLESLSDYLLVSVEERVIEHHHRIGPSQWLLTEHRAGAIELEALGIALPLDALYADLDRLARGAPATGG